MTPVENYQMIWGMLAKEIGLEKESGPQEATEENTLSTV
jgi:hypothetical protein